MSETDITLTDFLLARFAEDEEVARATKSERFVAYVDDCDWHIEAEGVSHLANFGRESWPLVGQQVAHIARHDPARVLAECEAKRRIVEDLSGYCFSGKRGEPGIPCGDCDRIGCRNLRALAAIYGEHPDYQSEWKP